MLAELLLVFSFMDAAVAYHLKILNSHDGEGAAPCVAACAGTTSRGSTAWDTVEIDTEFHGGLFEGVKNVIRTSVDISGCHFVKTPIVTTTIDFNSDEAGALTFLSSLISGSSTIAETSEHSFSVYLHGFQDTRFPLVAAGAGLVIDVHWSAFGYIC